MMNEFILASPIIAISAFSILLLMLDAFSTNKKIVFPVGILFLLITLVLSAITAFIPASEIAAIEKPIAGNMLLFGAFPAFFDILFCLVGIMTFLSGREFIQKFNKPLNEYYTLVMLAITGMITIAHSNNLLMTFLGIELMSIVFYVLAGFFRERINSIEAAMKYFILGSFATGFLIYGIAMLYGATGVTDASSIVELVKAGTFNSTYLTIGIGLVIVGLSFKIAAFPFHQWAPDVYTGSPTVITGFMSTAGKAAAFSAFIIVAGSVLLYQNKENADSAHILNVSLSVLAVISAITMLIGNISALTQKNVKRMLAYSSVAHAGYMMMGLVSNTTSGYTSIMFYAAAYTFMQFGAFAIVSILEKSDESNTDIDDYKGLHRRNPVLAFLMTIFMLSLAGIPPMAGFFGKYFLFVNAINAGYVWLTVIAVIASIISMYFYIGLNVFPRVRNSRACKSIYFGKSLAYAFIYFCNDFRFHCRFYIHSICDKINYSFYRNNNNKGVQKCTPF